MCALHLAVSLSVLSCLPYQYLHPFLINLPYSACLCVCFWGNPHWDNSAHYSPASPSPLPHAGFVTVRSPEVPLPRKLHGLSEPTCSEPLIDNKPEHISTLQGRCQSLRPNTSGIKQPLHCDSANLSCAQLAALLSCCGCSWLHWGGIQGILFQPSDSSQTWLDLLGTRKHLSLPVGLFAWWLAGVPEWIPKNCTMLANISVIKVSVMDKPSQEGHHPRAWKSGERVIRGHVSCPVPAQMCFCIYWQEWQLANEQFIWMCYISLI